MGVNLNARGYNEVEERGNFIKLPPDGYVCKIVKADFTRSQKGNDMIVTCVDICEGKYTGYFMKIFNHLRQKDPQAKWPSAATMYQNLFDAEGRVNSGLKSLIRSVERSNVNFIVNTNDFEAATFNGKIVGVIFGEEEWERDGKSGVTTRATFPRDAQKIRDGDFRVPPLKKLDSQKSVASANIQPTDDFEPPPKQDSDFGNIDDPPF